MTTLPFGREVIREELLRLERFDRAREHPAFLLHFARCVDSRSGDVFDFQILSPEEADLIQVEHRGEGWFWQRELLDWWIENDQTVVLKGRQLGVTWVACGLALWYLLFRPGADILIYSIGEDEAKQVVERIWDMYQSLPDYLRGHVRTTKPSRDGVRPSELISVEHEDKRVTSIQAMASTATAGHSRSAAFILFDEGSRHPYARESWRAVVPATADSGGKVAVVSTANGMSNTKTGEGNFFHALWTKAGKADYPLLRKKFLGWWLHPDRDEQWYVNLSFEDADKAEQYPQTPEEAFLLSGSPFFSKESLKYYSEHIAEPLYRCRFEIDLGPPVRARIEKSDDAPIYVYEEPVEGHSYGVAVDCATGAGTDYTVIVVLDLANFRPVLECQTKEDQDNVAEWVHFIGRWYNTARIAVENQGGYGQTMLTHLRHKREGRPAYPKIYKHRKYDRPDRPESAKYGFPMDVSTRPHVLNELRAALRSQAFPWVTEGFLMEAVTFVYRDTRPSPRAADGCNDDTVLAYAIACELYREFGEHPQDYRKVTKARRARRKPKKSYPWQ